ncbi:hypothetical protein LDG_6205 [Legionella drancourtii LLAP12]|uniref:Uncharacterized protein n=1 Tax=Legionella drancourtii LLAP12 TaxID=658187 RepID=G9ELU5_9GAMM|nr:hypothetical protein LDG_6205 [Legionella drancourtii LLAP12]
MFFKNLDVKTVFYFFICYHMQVFSYFTYQYFLWISPLPNLSSNITSFLVDL